MTTDSSNMYNKPNKRRRGEHLR